MTHTRPLPIATGGARQISSAPQTPTTTEKPPVRARSLSLGSHDPRFPPVNSRGNTAQGPRSPRVALATTPKALATEAPGNEHQSEASKVTPSAAGDTGSPSGVPVSKAQATHPLTNALDEIYTSLSTTPTDFADFEDQARQGFPDFPPAARRGCIALAETLGIECGSPKPETLPNFDHFATNELLHAANGIAEVLLEFSGPTSLEKALTQDPMTSQGLTGVQGFADSVFKALRGSRPVSEEGEAISGCLASCMAAIETLQSRPSKSEWTEEHAMLIELQLSQIKGSIAEAQSIVEIRRAAERTSTTTESIVTKQADKFRAEGKPSAIVDGWIKLQLEKLRD